MHLDQHMWSLFKRQSGAPVINAACYAVANNFCGVAQSIGLTGDLCNPSGPFSKAYYEFTSCTSRHSTTDTAATTTLECIGKPLSYCVTYISNLVESVYDNSAASAYTSSLCSSYASVGSSPAASWNITCSQFSSSTTTYQIPSTSAPTASSTQSVASSTASSAAASITPAPSPLGAGAIAGIAVGAVMGVLLIIAFVGFFIWRHRRAAKKRRLATATEPDQPGTETEKAQLHSDSYQPKREELEGSKAAPRVRVIPGLNELEYNDMKAGRGEMAANEVATPELADRSTAASGTVSSGSTAVQDGSGQSRT